jgi:hypothetical protein
MGPLVGHRGGLLITGLQVITIHNYTGRNNSTYIHLMCGHQNSQVRKHLRYFDYRKDV